MQQLSSLDASFLSYETPNTPMHVGFIQIYDPSAAPGGKVRFKDILHHIEQRLHGFRGFRQKLVRVPFDLDNPYWIEDASFDLEYHVRHIALPQPGDWRQFCIQVARLHSRPLDLTKPLWEFTIIEGLDKIEGFPKGCFALVAKIHHAAIDGVSGMDMISALTDLSPDAPTPEPKAWQPETEPSPLSLLAQAQINNFRQPLRFLEVFQQSLPGFAKMGSGLARGDMRLPGGGKVPPRTRFNAKISPHRVLDGRTFDLGVIRRIREVVPGATVNDVVLAIVGGALRKYLNAKSELPTDSLIAMAPISVRTEMERGTFGNQVSAMMVALGTHLADPLVRLEYVHDDVKNSKALTSAVGARTLTQYSEFIPSGLAGLAARFYTQFGMADRTAPTINTVVSNVPGPQAPLYFAGARMVAFHGMGPISDGMGLIHAVVSYLGAISVAFTSDRDMLPDPAFYAQCLQDSFDELKSAAAARVQPGDPIPSLAGDPASSSGEAAAKRTGTGRGRRRTPT